MPSTMINLPGNSCGVVKASMASPSLCFLETQGAAKRVGEQIHLPSPAPDFQLGVAAGFNDDVHAPAMDSARDGGDDAAMTSIQPIGDAQQCRPGTNDLLSLVR